MNVKWLFGVMKLAVWVLLFFAVSNLQANDCTPGDILISTQSAADQFQANYGSDCSVITGNVTIGPTSPDAEVNDIVNLDELANINTILGDLIIVNNVLLAEIDGLSKLTTVAGDVQITNNESLTNCAALNVLLDGFYDGVLDPITNAIADVGGQTTVSDNAEGCNSVQDIAPAPIKSHAMTGSWYSPSSPGAGFMWHAVNEELAVAYYYGFTWEGDDVPEGKRFWLIGVHEGPIDWSSLVTFDTKYITGGRFENFQAGQTSENHFGTIELASFCDSNTLTITGTFPGDIAPESFFTHMERLAPTAGYECYRTNTPTHPSDGLTGSWYDPSSSGQGFAIHKVDEDTGIIYFYGFDRAGEPLWLIGVWDGEIEFGKEISLTMNEVSGGSFLFFPASQVEEYEWGVLRIRFDDCTTGWASMFGADGTQEFELELLAGSAGLSCSTQ